MFIHIFRDEALKYCDAGSVYVWLFYQRKNIKNVGHNPIKA